MTENELKNVLVNLPTETKRELCLLINCISPDTPGCWFYLKDERYLKTYSDERDFICHAWLSAIDDFKMLVFLRKYGGKTE